MKNHLLGKLCIYTYLILPEVCQLYLSFQNTSFWVFWKFLLHLSFPLYAFLLTFVIFLPFDFFWFILKWINILNGYFWVFWKFLLHLSFPLYAFLVTFVIFLPFDFFWFILKWINILNGYLAHLLSLYLLF